MLKRIVCLFIINFALSPIWAVDKEELNELLIVSTEKKALAQVNKLIQKHRGTSMEPELLLRKGALYQRMGKSARYFDFRREESGASTLLPPVVKDLDSRRMIQQAIAVFEEMRRRFPRFSRSDEVIFNIAFSLQQLGEGQKAKNRFLELCRLFPDSAMVPDAFLAAGEIDFENKQFASALQNYRSIPQQEESFAYAYSVYKSGWSLYNMQRVEEGLSQLEKIAKLHDVEDPSTLGLNLRPDSLNDMVLFFADIRKWHEAIPYFQTHAKEKAPFYVFKLGKIYQYRGQWDEMIELYQAFLKRFLQDEKMPDVYVELLNGLNRQKHFSQVVDRLKEFQKVCRQRCEKVFLTAAQEYAVKWHKNWRQTKNGMYGEQAITSYELYLEVKTGGLAKDKTKFQLAELLFELGRFQRASLVYEEVGQVIADPLLAHDAPYGAIVSLEKAVGDGSWSPENVRRFHSLVDLYVERNPQGKYRLDLTFKKASIAYDNKDYTLAAGLFLEIGKMTPANEKVIKAQNLYLDILSLTKDYANLAKMAGAWMKTAEPERKTKLYKIAVEAEFAAIQALREKGELKTAAQMFAEFTRKHEKSELAEKAWWNRIHILLDLARSAEAAAVSLQFSGKYPKSEYALEALKLAAAHFEKAAELEPAAKALEKLAAVEKTAAAKADRLFAAAQFYHMLGDNRQAAKLYRQVATGQNESAKKAALLWSGIPSEKAAALKVMQDSSIPELQAFAHFARAKELFHHEEKFSEAFRTAGKVLSYSAAEAAWKAEARWLQAQILKDEFIRQSVITSEASRLPLVLSIKTEKLQKTQQALQAVIRYGHAEFAVRSYLELGRLYGEYIRSLTEMKLPTGLSEADQQALRQELTNLVAPMEDQAAQSFAEGLKFAEKHGVFSPTVALLQDEFNKVNMRTDALELTGGKIDLLPMMPEWRAKL